VPLLLILAMGCSTPEPPAPFLAFGTGERTFEPLMDGDDGVVIQGPQGGHHLLGSIQIAGVVPGTDGDLSDPDNPTTSCCANPATAAVPPFRLRRLGPWSDSD